MQSASFRRGGTLGNAPRDLNLLQTYGSTRAVCCRLKITRESAEMVSPLSDYGTLVLGTLTREMESSSSFHPRRARGCVSRVEIKAGDKADTKS